MIFLSLFFILFAQPSLAAPIQPFPLDIWSVIDSAGNSGPRDDLNDPALFPATREFGPTVISLRELPYSSEVVTAVEKPWSSWWFPRLDATLFQGGDSPLEKYDRLRTALNNDTPSKAAEWEQSRYRADGPAWEGLCDAWAIASIAMAEPIKDTGFRINGGRERYDNYRLRFTVGDQKALLLKTFEAVPVDSLKIYGQKFLGDVDGWIYPDLFPQEMHRFIEKQIFERKQAFVMDHDPGVQVWSEPVYKANYKIETVEGRSDAVLVKMWLYSAAPLRKEDINKTGTKEIVREYNYYLYGSNDGAGNLTINSGEWASGRLVDSRRDHPDYVFALVNPRATERKSYNTEIDPKIVDRILRIQETP